VLESLLAACEGREDEGDLWRLCNRKTASCQRPKNVA
jgi:hypothetical protein